MNPEFGQKLFELKTRPVWIVMSAANEPAIRSLWALAPNATHLDGITSLTPRDGTTPESRFLGEIETIDLHHGPYSSNDPYTALEVIGAKLTSEIKSSLIELGFTDFSLNQTGFVAERSIKAAKQLRGD